MRWFGMDLVWWCIFAAAVVLWILSKQIRSFVVRTILFVRLGRITQSSGNFSRTELPVAVAGVPRFAALRASLESLGFRHADTLTIKSGSLRVFNDVWVSVDGLTVGIISRSNLQQHRALFAFTSFLPEYHTIQTADHAGSAEMSGMSDRVFHHEMPAPALFDVHRQRIAGRDVRAISGDILAEIIALNEARWRRCVELGLMRRTAEGFCLTLRAKWLAAGKRHTKAVREATRQIRERRQSQPVPVMQSWGGAETDSSAAPVLQYSAPPRGVPIELRLGQLRRLFSWLLAMECFSFLLHLYSFGMVIRDLKADPDFDASDFDWLVSLGMDGISCILTLVSVAFLYWAGRLLRREGMPARKAFAVSMTASILPMLSFQLGCFWLVGLGLGIYSLIILCQPEMRRHLKTRESGMIFVPSA